MSSSVPSPHSTTTPEVATSSSEHTPPSPDTFAPPARPAVLSTPPDTLEAFNAAMSATSAPAVVEDPSAREIEPDSGLTRSERKRFELEGMMGMHRRLIRACEKQCLHSIKDADLASGEARCVDNCVLKYISVQTEVGLAMRRRYMLEKPARDQLGLS